jgi:ABC-2 type transport system ATP-binding protein
MRRAAAMLTVLAATAATGAGLATAGAASSAPAYSVQTLHFLVHVGPTGAQDCDVIGDLYTPATASASHLVPAILTTNGFGGSKDDQAGIGAAFATRGYEVLSYSGLGFGGSGCQITLDDPDWDGRAASQLISFLGGDTGIAFTDAAHTIPVLPLDVVMHDGTDHRGGHELDDPRVGMIGGSYGGEVQFAAADVDPRLDTIVPLITWSDLSYSIDPNNTSQTTGVSTSTPGAIKLNWGLLFSLDGVISGVQNAPGDPQRLFPCPNFATFVCPALVTAGSTGFFQPDAIAAFRHASVASYVQNVTIPTLIIQGENDTLFNLNEAIANYQALRANHTPVTMIWQSWGHSNSTPAPGELSLANPDPTTQYETARVAAWFDHYLLGAKVSTGPGFAYFRDWVSYTGIATPAYATAPSFPVSTNQTLYLSGDGALVSSPLSIVKGTRPMVTPPAGAPTSVNPLDVLGSFASGLPTDTEFDAPGTAIPWTSAALAANLDVVGSPRVRLTVSAPGATSAAGPGGMLVLFVKILDVAPDGTASLIHGLEAPVRVPDATQPFTVTLPAIVHEFAAGHSIRLVIAGGSINYRGGLTPTTVTVRATSKQTLTLPVAG